MSAVMQICSDRSQLSFPPKTSSLNRITLNLAELGSGRLERTDCSADSESELPVRVRNDNSHNVVTKKSNECETKLWDSCEPTARPVIPTVSISPIKSGFANDIINGKLDDLCEVQSNSSPTDTAVEVGVEGTNDQAGTPTLYLSGTDDWSDTYKGILLPKLNNDFKDGHLEAAYQRYSQRQRQKSLVILNVIDVILKLSLLIIYAISEKTAAEEKLKYRVLYNLPWFIINLALIILITCWKQFANNYLHLGALFTWIIFNIQG